MEVDELQRRILDFSNRWHQARGYEPDELVNFAHLVEEVGELATQYVNERARPSNYDESELEDAIADILLQLVSLAARRNVNIERLLIRTMAAGDLRMGESSDTVQPSS